MPVISFKQTHPYGTLPGSGISVPVQLRVRDNFVCFLAKLDTGAEHCFFQREYGEGLGLDVATGERRTFNTVAGNFDAYGHNVTLECFGYQFAATVYFASTANFPRNVVGRNGWLNRFRLAIIDHDAILHASHYDDD